MSQSDCIVAAVCYVVGALGFGVLLLDKGWRARASARVRVAAILTITGFLLASGPHRE